MGEVPLGVDLFFFAGHAVGMSVQMPEESGPLWSALVEILNSERSEKQRLKEDIDLLSAELERARQLHLATYQELQSAETTMSKMVYPDEPETLVRTPKQVLDRSTPASEPRSRATEGKRSTDRVTYDKSLKLQATGTPVIGTLTPNQATTSAKKVRFQTTAAATMLFQSPGPERRNLSQTLSASASPSTAGKALDYYSSPTRHRRQMVPREEGAVAGGRTPSKDLIEAKWKERCLTAEYKQKALEQQVSDMETDMITMSLKLEDKLDLQDRLLVKRFEIKNIEKWQQYTLRKSLLLVRALSRQVGDAMAAFGSTANKSEREQRVKGWKMVLQDLEAVVLSINRAGIKNKEGKGAAGRRKNFDFDLDDKAIESLFAMIDADGDGMISLSELKYFLEALRSDVDKRPLKLPAPVPLVQPQEGDSSTGMKLGDFFQELMEKHKKIKHFGKRKEINVKRLNKLSAKLLKSVYFTYCSFGMGHGEEHTHHSNIMDGNNFAKLCRECSIISDLPPAEADIFFAAVTEMYSRNLTFEEFLHALLMVSEESGQELHEVITQVIDHGVPEIHVRTKKPMPPILKTAARPEVWQRKKADEDTVQR